ncbi:MAG: hypothetical protein ACFFDM_03670 [Candidatus Thorarchaeota archaeon]
MQARRKKTVVISLFLLMLYLVMIPAETQFTTSRQGGTIKIEEEDSKYQPEAIIEGERIFHTSAAGDDYVDSYQGFVVGTNISAPPLGMGEDSASATELTESYYAGTIWTNLLTQAIFEGLPSGWEDSNMIYGGYGGYFGSDPFTATSGYLTCSGVSTSGYDTVRFTVLCISTIIQGGVYIDFYDSSSNWDEIGTIPGDMVEQDYVFSSIDSQYMHSNFRVRLRYVQGMMDGFAGKNWRIDAGDDYEARGLDITYKFADVDFNSFTSEQLYVEFDSNSSSEYLDFRFESGDTTPDFLIGDDQNSTFNVDIHEYLDGSECYVNIRDEYQIDDDDTDYWKIRRMYIRLTNTAPENVQAPACTNLDDLDNLYARHRLYEFNISVIDDDGCSHIEYVDLESYDSSMTELRWSIRFNEDTNTFTEEAGMSFINLTGGYYSRSSTQLNVTFNLYIEWEHPDTMDDILVQYVQDSLGDFDEDSYYVNYDYETRLDIHGFSIDDGIGVCNWGNIGGSLTVSGTLTYLGSSINPNTGLVDVWVSASLNSGAGPWLDDSLDSGYFTMTVDADDIPGIDIYKSRVVLNGTGSEGNSQLHFIEGSIYVSDRVQVQGYTADDTQCDLNEASECYATLCYETTGSYVTDGTVTVNGINAIYTGSDGVWIFSETCSTAQTVLYDSVVVSNNSIGITEVNQNSQSISITWDTATTATSTGPTESTTPTTPDDYEPLIMIGTIGLITGAVIVLAVIVIKRK